MPCIIRTDALDFLLVNMYGFEESKICYAFGVDVFTALARYFWWEVYLLQVFDMVNPLCVININGMDKIMKTVVKDTYFFNMGHHFPVIQFYLE
jgi:hypothetical protein